VERDARGLLLRRSATVGSKNPTERNLEGERVRLESDRGDDGVGSSAGKRKGDSGRRKRGQKEKKGSPPCGAVNTR